MSLADITRNPCRSQFQKLMKECAYEQLRYIRCDREEFIWDSSLFTHREACNFLGLSYHETEHNHGYLSLSADKHVLFETYGDGVGQNPPRWARL